MRIYLSEPLFRIRIGSSIVGLLPLLDFTRRIKETVTPLLCRLISSSRESKREMEKIFAEKLIAEIIRMNMEKPKSFPYAGCRFVLEGDEEEFEFFIPDLDLWSMNIAGYCSQGMRILRWPQEKLIEAQSRMIRGFYDGHPKYRRIQPFINESDTPDLYEYLDTYERMRRKLISVFSCLQEDNESHSA